MREGGSFTHSLPIWTMGGVDAWKRSFQCIMSLRSALSGPPLRDCLLVSLKDAMQIRVFRSDRFEECLRIRSCTFDRHLFLFNLLHVEGHLSHQMAPLEVHDCLNGLIYVEEALTEINKGMGRAEEMLGCS